MAEDDQEIQQHRVFLPDGSDVIPNGPIVIIGPNGSGKTRKSRTITSDTVIEVVSALRNTRISPRLPSMSVQEAQQNYTSERQRAKDQPHELANDFDAMLASLLSEAFEVSFKHLQRQRSGETSDLPDLAPLEQVQELWGELFPGRQLLFNDFIPVVINSVAVGEEPTQYSASQMSDGEKAALYLAGRTLSAAEGAVILVDEPETHFHSLLAAHFWDILERERPDLRFIYVTHDMNFAASRSAVKYLLANPKTGLEPIELASDAQDLAAVLLGTASLSFYATEVVFCEGEADSLDARLYAAWFKDRHTIVQPVGSCEMVRRSVAALSTSSLVHNLNVHGIIDRDFHPESTLSSIKGGVHPLGVHEVETLFALPGVAAAVAKHLAIPFDETEYTTKIIETYSDADRHRVVIERWKVRTEQELSGVIKIVSSKTDSLANITAAIPEIFDQAKWSFSPQVILADEKKTIEKPFKPTALSLEQILKLMPGKNLRSLAPAALGIRPDRYDSLIIDALRGDNKRLSKLEKDLRRVLKPYIPVPK